MSRKQKKLRAALRDHLTDAGGRSHLEELADKIEQFEPDRAAMLRAKAVPPDGAELEPENALWWEAWHDLDSERPHGDMGGAGRIPWSAINAYAEARGFDESTLKRLMWAMDAVFLDWLAAKLKEMNRDGGQG